MLKRKDILASVNKCERDWTPLMIAASKGRGEVVRLLLRHGANVNTTNDSGSSAVVQACYKGQLATAQMLVDEFHADIHQRERNGTNALTWSAHEGHEAVVRFLLQRGAKVNARAKLDWTPLMFACREGHPGAARALVQGGADVNAHTISGLTPLMLGARNGHFDVVCYLCCVPPPNTPNMDAVARVSATDAGTALQMAEARGHSDIVQYLTLMAETEVVADLPHAAAASAAAASATSAVGSSAVGSSASFSTAYAAAAAAAGAGGSIGDFELLEDMCEHRAAEPKPLPVVAADGTGWVVDSTLLATPAAAASAGSDGAAEGIKVGVKRGVIASEACARGHAATTTTWGGDPSDPVAGLRWLLPVQSAAHFGSYRRAAVAKASSSGGVSKDDEEGREPESWTSGWYAADYFGSDATIRSLPLTSRHGNGNGDGDGDKGGYGDKDGCGSSLAMWSLAARLARLSRCAVQHPNILSPAALSWDATAASAPRLLLLYHEALSCSLAHRLAGPHTAPTGDAGAVAGTDAKKLPTAAAVAAAVAPTSTAAAAARGPGLLQGQCYSPLSPLPLSWRDRVRIAAELVATLRFLHLHHRRPHGDLRSSSILLTRSMAVRLLPPLPTRHASPPAPASEAAAVFLKEAKAVVETDDSSPLPPSQPRKRRRMSPPPPPSSGPNASGTARVPAPSVEAKRLQQQQRQRQWQQQLELLPFSAPELHSPSEAAAFCTRPGVPSTEGDMFALGVVLAQLLTGLPAWDAARGDGDCLLSDHIVNFNDDHSSLAPLAAMPAAGQWPQRPATVLADIALDCVNRRPNRRPTIQQVGARLHKLQQLV